MPTWERNLMLTALVVALIHIGCDAEAPPDEQGMGWTRPDSPGEEMSGIACSDEQIVAVGFGVMTSPDGLTWTPSHVPSDWRLKKVTWGRSLFVAVGDTVPGPGRPVLATSSDGLTWTERPAPASADDVVWSGELFVGVDYHTILTSRDGQTWNAEEAHVDGGLRGITWGRSQFVAVGSIAAPQGDHYSERALILTSSDGAAWSRRDSPGAGLTDVAWSGERFVAVGNSILTSQDGTTWDPQSAPVDRFDLTGITWSGSQFAAVGRTPTAGGTEGLVITSPDGLTWTRRPAPSRGVEPRDVAWCGTRFVAVGALRRGWFADYTKALILTSPYVEPAP